MLEQGIFQAAAQALEWQNITGSDADELNELRAWFSDNLEKPLPSYVTSFASASVGSRPAPPSTSPAITPTEKLLVRASSDVSAHRGCFDLALKRYNKTCVFDS